MARIRTIKPQFWLDAKLANNLSRDQRLMYIGLWNMADDEGRFVANSRHLLGSLFPHDMDLNDDFIEESLRRMHDLGRIILYESADERYAQIVKWNDHQRIQKPKKSPIPPPPNNLATVRDSYSTSTVRVPDEYDTSTVRIQDASGTPIGDFPDRHRTGNDVFSDEYALEKEEEKEREKEREHVALEIERSFNEFWAIGGKGAMISAERAYFEHVPSEIEHAELCRRFETYISATDRRFQMDTVNWLARKGYEDTELTNGGGDDIWND